jgi:NADH dehydrogenase
MPTVGRKLRIWVEWTWGMLFAADVTHLRFTRTGEADGEPPVGGAPPRAPATLP